MWSISNQSLTRRRILCRQLDIRNYNVQTLLYYLSILPGGPRPAGVASIFSLLS